MFYFVILIFSLVNKDLKVLMDQIKRLIYPHLIDA